VIPRRTASRVRSLMASCIAPNSNPDAGAESVPRSVDGIAELVSDLTRGRIAADRPCHLDSDIDARSLLRQGTPAVLAWVVGAGFSRSESPFD
jgi:hypothetical protein